LFPAGVGDIPLLDLFPRPSRFTQKRQAGLDRRIILKAPDFDPLSHLLPAVILDKLDKNLFQRNPVQRIPWLFRRRGHIGIHGKDVG